MPNEEINIATKTCQHILKLDMVNRLITGVFGTGTLLSLHLYLIGNLWARTGPITKSMFGSDETTLAFATLLMLA